MKPQKRENPTLQWSGISENIHFDDVNGLQISTITGTINIEKFVCECFKHHQELLAKYDPLTANDYPSLDYSLHKRLIKKEFEDELWEDER